MAQNTVFAQVIKLISRSKFEGYVNKYDGDRGVRTLDCWTWFGALLFGQLSGHDSIRAIERVFAHSDIKMQRLGFGPVRKSTLADANRTRPIQILEEVFHQTLRLAKVFAPQKSGFRFKGQILALDSSTVELCLSLCPWARFCADRAAVKLNTAIDLAGDLPEFVVINNGSTHDLHAAKLMHFKPDTTVVFDRNYIQYKYFNELTQKGVFFVTRARDCLKFKVVQSRQTDRTRGHICDQIVYPKGQRGGQYKGKLRRISYRDPETNKKLVFITNRFDLATQTICDLYKARWKVELFFKTMKQNLKIRKFLGTSAQAVKAQIWVALIAYLLIQILRFQLKTNISIPIAMAVIATLLLLKEPVFKLLGRLPIVTRHPPNTQLALF